MTPFRSTPGDISVRSDASDSDFWPGIAVIASVGLVLRICGAGGDLWLDEVWSLDLVRRVTSVDQIFWRINHDNNHFLNSVWVYLAGPDASFVMYRSLSIVMGTATVFAAAMATAGQGRTTQYVAALLFAVSYPIVNFGSEERGYSGLILFSLLAVWALEKRLDGRSSGLPLAVIILLGFLSHLTMIATVLVLVIWTVWKLFQKGGRLAPALAGTVRIFLPAFFAVLPLAAVMAFGAWTYGFTIGGLYPFTLENYAIGLTRMTAFFVGVPFTWPSSVLILLAILLASLCIWAAPRRRSSLYLMGVVGLPLFMLALRLPGLQFARYFLPSLIILMLSLAAAIGHNIDRGGWRRIVAAGTLAVFLCANSLSLLRFFESGRGTYAELVAELTVDPETSTYASADAFRNKMMVDFYARRLGRSAEVVRGDEICRRPPEFFVTEIKHLGTPSDSGFISKDCDLIYDGIFLSQRWGLSGIDLALYRRRY